MNAESVKVAPKNVGLIGNLPPEIETCLNIKTIINDKKIILMKFCARDIIRRVFFVNSLNEDELVYSLRHMKYTYVDATKYGITDSRVKEKDLGLVYPNTDEFRIIINTFLNEGYIVSNI